MLPFWKCLVKCCDCQILSDSRHVTYLVLFIQTCLPGLDEQPDLHRAAGMAARRELRAPTRFMAGV